MIRANPVRIWFRSPYVEHPLESPLEEAVAIGYSGLDIYGAHSRGQ